MREGPGNILFLQRFGDFPNAKQLGKDGAGAGLDFLGPIQTFLPELYHHQATVGASAQYA